MIQLKNEIEEIRIFIKNKKCGLFLMTVVLMLVYGIRAVHDDFYIDSEIMFQKPGLFCLVLSWGVYQVYVPLYITLVLVSFVLVYLNGNPERTFEYGVRHILLFFIGCLTYMILVKAVRIAVHTDSTYVSDLIHWKTEGIAAGIQAVITTMMRAAIGHGVFYQKWYAPAMLLFCIQCMYLGWKKKKSLVDYGIFLISGILLVLSPFYLTILSGAVQSVRTEMVYPVAAALFLAHLTVWPENGRKWEKWKTAAISLVCVVCII